MTFTLYGISNCDTVRKARKWLDAASVDYRFHDFRADGLDAETVSRWFDAAGWDSVLNKRSTSWKALPADERDAMDAKAALAAILSAPTLIKRPVLESAGLLEFGFREDRYQRLTAGK